MGVTNSKTSTHGTLNAAHVPLANNDLTLPELPKKERKFTITVPKGKTTGDNICIRIGDNLFNTTVPYGKARTSTGNVTVRKRLEAGDTFEFTRKAEIEKVISSTLPLVPGYEILQSKPIIRGSVSHTFRASARDQQSMGNRVGELVQQVHDELMEQAIEAECNGVLGIQFNITNDSSGEHGNVKVVIVTGFGTPCLLVKSAAAPAVQAEAVVALGPASQDDDLPVASATAEPRATVPPGSTGESSYTQ